MKKTWILLLILCGFAMAQRPYNNQRSGYAQNILWRDLHPSTQDSIRKAIADSLTALSADGVTIVNDGGVFKVVTGGIGNTQLAGGILASKLAGSISDDLLNQLITANKVAGSAVQLNSSGALSNSSGLKVNYDGVTLDVSSNILQVPTQGISWANAAEDLRDSVRLGAGTFTKVNSPDGITVKENADTNLTMVDTYLVQQFKKDAINQLSASFADSGTVADTIGERTTVTGSWTHPGRLEVWSPASTYRFNNFAFKKHGSTMTVDDTLYIYESSNASADDATITNTVLIAQVVLDKDVWNAASAGDWIDFYTQTITAVNGRHYYFYWKQLSENRGVKYSSDSFTNSNSLFWNTGTGNWANASPNYAFRVRYNSGISIKLNIPTTYLSGTLTATQLPTIEREKINTDAVLGKKWKAATEQLDITTVSTGTPADTFYNLATQDQNLWDFGGQVIRWQYTGGDTVINNIGLKRIGDNVAANTVGVIYRGTSLVGTDAEITALDSLTYFDITTTNWNNVSSGNFVYFYFEDIEIDSSYYYYFYWKHTSDNVKVWAGTRTDGIADLFWNSGGGDWAGTSTYDWNAQIRYNSNIVLKLEVGADNVSDVTTSNFSSNLSTWVGARADSTNPLRLLLPDTVYIAGDSECNIYWDNIILTQDYSDFSYDVTCDSGYQFSQGWRFQPAEATSANIAWSVTIKNWANETVGSGSTVLKVSPGTATGSAKTILFIGNSLTAANTYPTEVKTLAGANLTAVGTQGSTPHEGYGGKTWAWHESDASSPFVYSSRFDFQQYLTDNSYADPDFVIIHLGTNDAYAGADTATVSAAMDTIIAGIKADAPSARIGVCMIIPPSYEQDSFGTNYGNGVTRWDYKTRQHAFNEFIKAKYGVSGYDADASVFVIPVYVNLDTEHNMATTATAYNARNATTYNRQTNGLHPATSGYQQMADMVWGWIAGKD